jgi:hypothetical protein
MKTVYVVHPARGGRLNGANVPLRLKMKQIARYNRLILASTAAQMVLFGGPFGRFGLISLAKSYFAP